MSEVSILVVQMEPPRLYNNYIYLWREKRALLWTQCPCCPDVVIYRRPRTYVHRHCTCTLLRANVAGQIFLNVSRHLRRLHSSLVYCKRSKPFCQATGACRLYNLFIYLYNIIRPTPLAPGWPRATHKCWIRNQVSPAESVFSTGIGSGSISLPGRG